MSPELSFSPYPAPEATILRSEGFTVGRRKLGEKKAVKQSNKMVCVRRGVCPGRASLEEFLIRY